MSDANQYDAEQVFDDVTKPAVSVPKDAQARALRRVVQQAQTSRLPPPRFSITIISVGPKDAPDVGETSTEDDAMSELLGVLEDEGDALFAPVDSPELPVTQNLYRKYRAALPAEKVVRVDTDESYGRFLDGQRAPYTEELEQRLAELEQVVSSHISDDTGRLAELEGALADHMMDPNAHHIEVLGAAVEEARERAAICGEKIPLSLHPSTEGSISCWQGGDQIYCSIRALGADGKPRVLTTATPAQRHVEEVISYAADAKVDPIEVMGTLPVLAQVLGGGALVTQLTKMAPELLSRPEVVRGDAVVVKAKPEGDAACAAVMSLLQLCRRGDKVACAEADKLRASTKGAALVAQAENALKKALKK